MWLLLYYSIVSIIMIIIIIVLLVLLWLLLLLYYSIISIIMIISISITIVTAMYCTRVGISFCESSVEWEIGEKLKQLYYIITKRL